MLRTRLMSPRVRFMNIRIIFATSLIFICASCANYREPLPETQKEIGWFSAAHFAHPDAMVNVGIGLFVNKPEGTNLTWRIGRKIVEEVELRKILTKVKSIGSTGGFLVDASDDTPVWAIKKTLSLLHESNQREVVLFRMIEGVESDFFWDLFENKDKLIEVKKESIGIGALIAERAPPHHRTYGSRIRRFGCSKTGYEPRRIRPSFLLKYMSGRVM